MDELKCWLGLHNWTPNEPMNRNQYHGNYRHCTKCHRNEVLVYGKKREMWVENYSHRIVPYGGDK